MSQLVYAFAWNISVIDRFATSLHDKHAHAISAQPMRRKFHVTVIEWLCVDGTVHATIPELRFDFQSDLFIGLVWFWTFRLFQCIDFASRLTLDERVLRFPSMDTRAEGYERACVSGRTMNVGKGECEGESLIRRVRPWAGSRDEGYARGRFARGRVRPWHGRPPHSPSPPGRVCSPPRARSRCGGFWATAATGSADSYPWAAPTKSRTWWCSRHSANNSNAIRAKNLKLRGLVSPRW